MIRVNILDTSPPNQGRGISKTVNMKQCPAVGESICEEDNCITVKAVLWTPGNGKYDVQVRAW